MADNHHRPEDEHHDYRLPDMGRPGTSHEKTDIDISAIVRFGIGLCALAVVSFVLIWASTTSSNRSMEGRCRPPASRSPPAPCRPSRASSRRPWKISRKCCAAQDKLLHTYGWVDQQHGIVRIPIDRAIDMLAQRGLPSRPAAGPSVPPPMSPYRPKAASDPS